MAVETQTQQQHAPLGPWQHLVSVGTLAELGARAQVERSTLADDLANYELAEALGLLRQLDADAAHAEGVMMLYRASQPLALEDLASAKGGAA